ncbi:PLC-like phosphodiesterase [Chytriomyces sp. MP71]|nr:PLC-like phosphodiesterase [Chytriomyces sp. MP71]
MAPSRPHKLNSPRDLRAPQQVLASACLSRPACTQRCSTCARCETAPAGLFAPSAMTGEKGDAFSATEQAHWIVMVQRGGVLQWVVCVRVARDTGGMQRLFSTLNKGRSNNNRLEGFGAAATQLMSHRGGSLEAIENTLPAFRRSAALGVPLILEMDICMTRDGHPVVFHDDDMGRLCGPQFKGRSITEYALSELPPLVIPEALKGIVSENDKEARRIPRFQEVVEEFPTFPMQVDVKAGSEAMILQVANLITTNKREHLTVWGTFRHAQNEQCYNYFGTRIPLFFSWRRWMASYALSWVGLTHWMEYRESCLIVPNWQWVLRRKWFEDLNRLGISVIVWGSKEDVANGPGGGINTVEGFERVKRSGANGICTDRPTLLKEWLKTNQLEPVDRFGNKEP